MSRKADHAEGLRIRTLGKTPNPLSWDGCVPRHPLQIRFIVGGKSRFALDGSHVGLCVGDRPLPIA